MSTNIIRDDSSCTVYSDDSFIGRRVDKATGEVEDVSIFIAPVGSRVITPDQQKAINSYRKRQAELNIQSKRSGKKKPPFTWVSTEADFSEVSPANITRLIYLSTYLSFHNSELRIGERRKLTKGMLPEVLGVGERTVERFLCEVSPTFLLVDNKGNLSLNTVAFAKGAMKNMIAFYIKVFAKGMQELYNSVPKSKHKQLGYVFALLRYINVEHNILCHNPDEVDIEKIEPMTMQEFCVEIGYDYRHVDRLHKVFKGLTFDVGGGKRELFCSIIKNEYTGKELMIVNPRVFYSGKNAEAVAEFGAFY